MDFTDLNKLKKKALDFTQKASKTIKDTTKTVVDNSAKKLWNSNFVIKQTEESLEETVEKTIIENKKVWIIFWEESEEFYKKLLVYLPVIWTKSFSKNFSIKIVNVKKWDDVCGKYSIENLPTLVFFNSTVVEKTFSGEEEILEMVKKLSLDLDK